MGPFYSGNAVRACRQLLADLLIVAWCGAAWLVSDRLRESIRAMIEPGAQASARLGAVSADLQDTATEAGRLPLIGSTLSDQLRSLSEWTAAMAGSGDAQVASLARAGDWAVTGVLVTAVAIGLLAWAPPRIRFVRASLQLGGAGFTSGGDSLLALRAMSSQPIRRLRRVHPDPVSAWRRDDPQVTAALARLELREYGRRYRPAPAAPAQVGR